MLGETGSTACVADFDICDENSDHEDVAFAPGYYENSIPESASKYSPPWPPLLGLGSAFACVVLAAIIAVGLRSISASELKLTKLEASLAVLLQEPANLAIDQTTGVGSPRHAARMAASEGFGQSSLGPQKFDAKPKQISSEQRMSRRDHRRGRYGNVQDIFSLGESLALSRISELTLNKSQDRHVQCLDAACNKSQNISFETGAEAKEPDNITSIEASKAEAKEVDDTSNIATPTGNQMVDETDTRHQEPAEVDRVDPITTTPVVSQPPVPDISDAEISERKTLLQSQVKAMQEQGYSVLLAPPGAASQLAEPTASPPKGLHALLLEVGLAPARAASATEYLRKRGIHIENMRSFAPKELAAALSAPELGLTAGEQMRAVTGLWHMSGSTPKGMRAPV